MLTNWESKEPPSMELVLFIHPGYIIFSDHDKETPSFKDLQETKGEYESEVRYSTI